MGAVRGEFFWMVVLDGGSGCSFGWRFVANFSGGRLGMVVLDVVLEGGSVWG